MSNPKPIKLVDLRVEIDALWGDLSRAAEEVLRSGRFILGPNVAAFETEVARALRTRSAVGLASGTDALIIGLRALGVARGDEVIAPAFTFLGTAGAIAHVGAVPVFVDIELDTFNLDPAALEPAVTARTRAIVPVHLFGLPADMDAVLELARRHDLQVLEDASQAFGAEYRGRSAGALGRAGAFSLYPTKNLAALGEAGILVTDDPEVESNARLLRNHGMTGPYHSELLGYSSRLDELQAALLRVKLAHVSRANRARRELASHYGECLAGVNGIALPTASDHSTHVYHQYTVRIGAGRRDEVRARLAELGIESVVYYPEPIYRSRPFHVDGLSLPRAEQAAAEALSLPIGPHLAKSDVERVVEALSEALA